MSFRSNEFGIVKSADPVLPTGLQDVRDLDRRRIAFLIANLILNVIALALMIVVLLPAGWTNSDSLILLSAVFVLPPLVLAFLNSALGFALKRMGRRGLAYAAPHLPAAEVAPALTARTAILLTLRNDPVEEALRRLKLIRASVESTGEGGHFAFFILSDTSDPVLARREELLVHEWNKALPDFAPVTYRRRLVNAGFKAGNLADFCRNWGEHFDFLVPLDARSFVTGVALVQMARVMQASPKIGILQAVAIHAPKARIYARFRAFVARISSEVSALGEAAWRADCADYSGRNAIVRINPFYLHCRMPHLSGRAPFGGAVVMHERIEAAYMRHAGYEVRSLPVEIDQFSDHSENIFDDLHETRLKQYALWQLPRFIGGETISPIYRAAWIMAIIEGVAPIFLTLAILLLAFKPFDTESLLGTATLGYAKWSYIAFLVLIAGPVLFGLIDTLFSRERIIAFGGVVRLLTSSVFGLVLTFLFYAPVAFRASFSLFASPFIRHGDQPVVESLQNLHRSRSAFRSFWPATLYGVDLMLLMLIGSPHYAFWSLPMMLGNIVVIPLVSVMSSVVTSRLAIRSGLFGVPETFAPPREIIQLVTRAHDKDLDRAA